MKNPTLFFRLSVMILAFGTVPLTGCSYIRAREARAAYGEYQSAVAAGDMLRARNALLKLVHADQDVGDYWIELGQLQLQLGAYREAYDAFAHAHELDRTNVQVLATMAQLALLSGDADLAREQADSLALVSPDNPTVTLVRSFAALKAGDLDKAEAGADSLLASAPEDSFANMLKAKVLIAKGQTDQAIALLENQHQAVPVDQGAIRGLSAIYESRSDWNNLARIQYDALRLDTRNYKVALSAIEAFLRAGNSSAAARLSAPLLSPSADPRLVSQALEMWTRYARPGIIIPDAAKLAEATSGESRVSFGDYFNQVGKPEAAIALLGTGHVPVTHGNARLNAVVAQAMALQGRSEEAMRLFNLVLDREPDQSEALRGRIALETKTGATKQAVIDAQRLVTINPNSGADRLLLAHAYLAAGNGDAVRRTLWQAFQDLPEDGRVFRALNSVLVSTGDTESQRRLMAEFNDRRQAKLTKDVI